MSLKEKRRKRLKQIKKKKKNNTGMKKPKMSKEDKAYWKRESKALAATEKDFRRIRQSMITAKSFEEIDRLLKESNALFLKHSSDSTARKTYPIREAANKRSKELGWTPEGGRPPRIGLRHDTNHISERAAKERVRELREEGYTVELLEAPYESHYNWVVWIEQR